MTTSIDWIHEIDASFDDLDGFDGSGTLAGDHRACELVGELRDSRGHLGAADGLAAYVSDRRPHVRRVAHAICCDWTQAEDAVRRILTDLGSAWPHLAGATEADGFVHRALARLEVQESPSPRSCGDHRADDVPVEDRSLIFDGLQSLPAVQRKVLVLHDWLDLPADDVAAALGLDVAVLHRHAARGRAALAMLML